MIQNTYKKYEWKCKCAPLQWCTFAMSFNVRYALGNVTSEWRKLWQNAKRENLKRNLDFSRNLPTEIRPGLKFRVLKRLAHRWIGNDRHRNTNKNSRKKKIPLMGFFCAQELLMLFWLDLDCVDPICLAYIIVDQMKYF